MAAKKPAEKPTEVDAPASEATEVEKPVKGESADTRKLRGELAAALARITELEEDAGKPKAKSKIAPLPEKYKGTKRYKLTQPCFVKGYQEAGSIIAVTDMVPSKTWIEVDNAGNPVKSADAE